MTNLPSGTVTFLFTDIEGSTKLAQGHRETWEALCTRHHAILHAAIESNNGYVFQIIGDAFCAAFHTGGDAINAAIKSQVDLQAENWGDAPIKVRMGIHTGEAKLQSNGDYHGYLAMSRVQRLMSAGHGGQVLISVATEELVRDELPENISLRDMGERRLKDLVRPQHIYQLDIVGLAADFPPLKTLETYRHNLPTQLTSFIGREKELSEIKQAVARHRLVTLTGSGGAGKTRLSLQVAADLIDQFPKGVWFVELAPITNPDLIPQTILSAAEMQTQQGRSALESLIGFLREKKSLLVLDNCEHLIETCAKLAEALLNAAPSLKILASSREALGVKGEQVWRVPSLSIPDLKHLAPFERLSQYEAVSLFIDRATLVQPHFSVTNENGPAVAQICIQLDGIPLAIELAAARVKVLQADQIAERLGDRFRLLTGGTRTALHHQQTLRSTIDWSYDLLSGSEKLLLRRLAVFAGGWTLEAAEAVCSGEGIESFEVLDLLARLMDKSLVVVDDQAQASRYRMLETIRQYALEKLIGFQQNETAHIKHLDFFLHLAENAEDHLIGPDQAKWLNYLEREHDNFRTALEWSIQAGKEEEGLQMAGALGLYWLKHSHYSEGRRWLGNILERHRSSSDQVQVKAWRWAGFLAFWQQDVEEARRIYTQNLEREQALGDQWGIAFSLHMLANIADLEGEVEKVRELHKQSIALSREIDAIWVLALAQFSLGYFEHTQGNLALAEELSYESLNHFRRLGEKFGMALVLSNLGYIMCSRGDFLSAKKVFLEALDVTRELSDKDGTAIVLTGLAGVFQKDGGYITSARLQGVVVAMQKEIGTALSLYPVEQEMFDSTAKALKGSMGAQAYQKEFESGMPLTLEEAVSLATGRN